MTRPIEVLRAHTSPYFSSNFNFLEKQELEGLGHVQYVNKFNTNSNKVLITDTHVDLNSFIDQDIDLIIHANSGYDNFTIEQIKALNIPIILGNEIRSEAVCDYIYNCLTRSISDLKFTTNWDHSRSWNRSLLSDLNITIIGYGQIGKILEKTLSPRVKNISFYDPYKNLNQIEFNEVVILACSLNEKNQEMINKSFLNQMPKNATLINSARGKLINWNDLVLHLKNNSNFKAYIDVFPNEPFPIEDFQNIKNLFMTSHIAGVFNSIGPKTIHFESKILKDFITLDRTEFTNKYSQIDLRQKIINDMII